MKKIFLIIFSFLSLATFAAKPKNTYVKISTNYGEVYLKLYNETPKHRDNFIKLVNEGTLNQTLFHRVIQAFMIQGGDPDSKTAEPGKQLGEGDLGYTIPAEFIPTLFHKKGALAAARDNNPEKASSASQFYIVQGKKFTDVELDSLEKNRLKGRKIPVAQREVYKTIGGTPHLDQNYTVFGEVVKGIQMVDNICTVKIDGNNRPLTDIHMTVSLVEGKELRKLLKEISQ
ncbi:MAG: peptidylprolyl isomerase [Bacteroidetes bacterium]|nr:peptidylprolyl isomerase [Bacteroidota bacterium]MBU1371751.1 peptidylprolyl isomerase [Bacteroidota bacterium]MBU1483756.1 peptidylprolyl isomerase [Bacteroidota bacterium]MBU1761250.1 peptidylprolyl isomerase [Bacteroidota bacterium]MBU2047129.1 peptidylprolyl isomerase [Bacteroidota bacterium]